MLPAIRQDLTLAQGDTLMILATVAEDAFGTAVTDASGFTLVVTIKAQLTDSDLAALVLADGTSQSVAGNVVRQAVPTAALTPGARLVYDARLIDPSARVFTYQRGNLFIDSPVTADPGDVTPVAPAGQIQGSRPLAFTNDATLTAIPTTGRGTGRYITGTIGGALTNVLFQAGNQTTGNGYWRPNDYDPVHNPNVWVQVG